MDKLHLSLEQDFLLIQQYNLSLEELYFIKSLIATKEQNKLPTGCLGDFGLIGQMAELNLLETPLVTLISRLQEVGIFDKKYKAVKGQTFDPEALTFTPTFTKFMFKDSCDLGEDLKDKYPAFVNVNGSLYSLGDFTKGRMFSPEEFNFTYGKSINWSVKKHQEILELIEWAKKYAPMLVSYNIGRFVASRGWETIVKAKENPAASVLAVPHDFLSCV